MWNCTSHLFRDAKLRMDGDNYVLLKNNVKCWLELSRVNGISKDTNIHIAEFVLDWLDNLNNDVSQRVYFFSLTIKT